MSREQTSAALHQTAADFVNRESNRQSLITVTKVELDERGLRCRIYITVFPDTKAEAALDFLSRRVDDFRAYVKKHIKMRSVPHCEFVQDPNIGGVETTTR